MKMNETVNKFLLVGDKFMREMHKMLIVLVVHLLKIKKELQTGNTEFIYRNEFDKACFQHDMAYGKTKDLVKGTQSDKVLKDKAFRIASDPKYDGYQRGLSQMVHIVFDKKSK